MVNVGVSNITVNKKKKNIKNPMSLKKPRPGLQSRNGKGDSGHAQRGEGMGKMLVYTQGRSLLEAPGRAELRAGPAGGTHRQGRAAASKCGWVLVRAPGQGAGVAERAVVTFAMKTPCFGEQGKGTERKPGGADVRMLRQSLFLTEEAVAFGARQ